MPTRRSRLITFPIRKYLISKKVVTRRVAISALLLFSITVASVMKVAKKTASINKNKFSKDSGFRK